MPYLSVSQVETALGVEGCLFKWGQRYLAHVKPERDGSALVGERVHGMNEVYMATGVVPLSSDRLTIFHKRRQEHITYSPGEIWASGKHLLPPRERVTCEGRFRFSTAIHGEPVWWQGAKDMEWQDETGLWHIGDLKTTVSFTYQKTADKLRLDWQANLYAYELMERAGVQAVALDWFTFITDPDKPRECRPTSIVVLRPEVHKIVAALEDKGRLLLAHYAGDQQALLAPHLPKNRGVPCVAFGGCPYRGTACPEPSLSELFGDQPMSDNVYTDFLGSLKTRLPTPEKVIMIPVAPPPPPVFRPWQPGDPLNETQQFMQGAGASLSAIANAADFPPSPEVAASYVAKPPPPVAVQPPLPVAVQPPPPISRPSVEAGFINPPEAIGKTAPITPEELEAPVPSATPQTPPQADELDTMERDDLKALGVSVGAFDKDCRWQPPRMRDAIRARLKKARIKMQSREASDPLPEMPFVATPAPDGLELKQVAEDTIRIIVREELRRVWQQAAALI